MKSQLPKIAVLNKPFSVKNCPKWQDLRVILLPDLTLNLKISTLFAKKYCFSANTKFNISLYDTIDVQYQSRDQEKPYGNENNEFKIFLLKIM